MQNPLNENGLLPIKKINWIELFIFYAIAILVSAPFRLGLIKLDELLPIANGLDIFYRIFRGIGPAVGFFVVYFILKSKVEKSLTFWGVNKWFSFLAVLIIPLGLTIVGVNNSSGLNEHYFGFLTGIMLIIYALGEEYGWRGYLQQALSPIKLPYRILTIAILWYLWHLNFLLPDFTVKTHIIFFLFLLLGSWGLLKISESTHSILFVVAVHLSFNVLSDVHADFNRKIIVIIVAIFIWVILLRLISKNKISGQPIEK